MTTYILSSYSASLALFQQQLKKSVQYKLILTRGNMREIFVVETFASKSVLVTGSTGFLGKVLLEKLLRSCQKIDKIFIPLRSKGGKTLKQRFEALKNSVVFENVKKLNPELLDKLIPIEADLMISPFANISEDNLKELKESVNFVFHCAASVKFDEPLKKAIQMNTIATRNLLDMSTSFKNLEAFVHVSTAFSNTQRKMIYENIYDSIYDYKLAIKLVETNQDEKLEQLRQFAMLTYPNTYIFSKNLTEQLVLDMSRRLPITIVRPSIVCPSINEPFPGWVDSMHGPMGVLIAGGSGVLRTVYGKGHNVVDIIPCDFATNSIIVAGASMATIENKQLKIYNCTSSKRQAITWNQFMELSHNMYKDYPSLKVVWFPGCRMCSNYYVYLVCFFLFQLLPAFFLDMCLLIAGKKSGFVKLQRRIFDSLKAFEYFMNNYWEWDSRNFADLQKLVSMHER